MASGEPIRTIGSFLMRCCVVIWSRDALFLFRAAGFLDIGIFELSITDDYHSHAWLGAGFHQGDAIKT